VATASSGIVHLQHRRRQVGALIGRRMSSEVLRGVGVLSRTIAVVKLLA
jgi:hypothetical protein